MIFVFFHIFLHTLTNMFFHFFTISHKDICFLSNQFVFSRKYIYALLHFFSPSLAKIFVFSHFFALSCWDICVLSHLLHSLTRICAISPFFVFPHKYVFAFSQVCLRSLTMFFFFFFLAFSHKDSCVLAHLFVFSWTARKMREIANILAREHKDSRGDAKVLWENTKALM